jgi:hypothetical protein
MQVNIHNKYQKHIKEITKIVKKKPGMTPAKPNISLQLQLQKKREKQKQREKYTSKNI